MLPFPNRLTLTLRLLSACLVLVSVLASPPAPAKEAAAAAHADVQLLLRRPEFEQIEISPDGTLLAIARRTPTGTIVSVHQRDGLVPVTSIDPGKNGEIDTLRWLDDDRLLVGANRADGLFGLAMIEPAMYIVRADGTDTFRLPGNFVATIDGDPDHLLVSNCGSGKTACVPEIRRAEINKLRRVGELVIAGPEGTQLLSDAKGNVRFAIGWEDDGTSKAWVHTEGTSGWALINDGSKTGLEVIPLGVSRDGTYGYLQSQRKSGPDAIERYDFASGTRSLVYADAESDPLTPQISFDGRELIGAMYSATRPRLHFWDPADPDAALLRDLQAAFPGRLAAVTSVTRDGQLAIVFVGSDRDPGAFYLFDRKARKANIITRSHPWLDPARLATQRSLEFKARDGLVLHGVLTLPPSSPGTKLPLIVLPHGGPYEVFDSWGFDSETQILAGRGYAVLQVNFRGSGSYGREFADRGLRQWGRAMQDDVTDATRWAIDQGIADPARICIYGASYGGYAALMGAIREPTLYRCAVGLSGVFDLGKMYKWGSIRRSDYGQNYLRRAIGDDKAELAANSPVNLADRITVPVLLAHGRLDARVDIKHARLMENRLEKHKRGVELIEYPYTGHSIVLDEHQLDFYARLLAFLETHLKAPDSRNAVGGTAASER